ncbi:MAG: helix-turn-helix transcriptional regulator [Clostridia bacterium]|nr:helix-turn-helix transcriptional regulator [Clostridia bacterium]
MDITIGKRMRELRAQGKNTQEQLATHLGVTIQAVSKWERGEGYPDIALLPAIAAYYDVTVDDLLGLDEAARQKKLAEYAARSSALTRREDAAARVRLWREAYREFPNEPMVLQRLSFALRAENIAEHAGEIIDLSLKLLKRATLSGHYFGAINNLCRVYASQGNMEEAKRYAAMAGRYIGTENQLMIHILEGEEAADFCKWNIETLTDLIAVNAEVMLQKGTFSGADQLHIAELIWNLFALIYEDGHYGSYHGRVSQWAMRAAQCHALNQEREETCQWLERALTHAARFDALTDGTYTAPIVRGVKYRGPQNQESQLALTRQALCDPCFDFVRDDARFKTWLAGTDSL